jgi:hypothetical protein
MAGCRAQWWAARSFKSYDDEVFIRKSSDDGSLIVTANGVEFSLSPDDTNVLATGYYHELKVFSGSDVTTAMTGDFIVNEALDMVLPYDQAPVPVRLVQGCFGVGVKYASTETGLEGPRQRPVRVIGY